MAGEKSEITWDDINKLALEISAPDGPGSDNWDLDSSHTKQLNASVIKALRENNGKIPGELETAPALILTTTGAKTGKKRTVPLAYHVVDDRLVVMASMGGAPRNPPWFHNLVHYPDVFVEKNGEGFSARAVVTEGEDRDHLFQKVCQALPVFKTYQERTERTIPVVELIRN